MMLPLFVKQLPNHTVLHHKKLAGLLHPDPLVVGVAAVTRYSFENFLSGLPIFDLR
jgi:hypothetical protein